MEGAVSSLPSSTRIAVVTGGNKGIGLEVCRQLAQNGITVILTARDETRGAAAVKKLGDLGLSDVIFHQLEVTDAGSVMQLAGFLKNRFGKLDILVIEALLPLLQASEDGRIVNVSSEYGQLRVFSNEQLKQELNDVENLIEERLDEVLATFQNDMEAGAVEARGWPTGLSAYKVSKAALNAYTRILARRHPELRVNCVHPGYVRTDMTIHSGFLTPEEGGSRVAAVALLPAGGPTGAFFMDRQQAPFV